MSFYIIDANKVTNIFIFLINTGNFLVIGAYENRQSVHLIAFTHHLYPNESVPPILRHFAFDSHDFKWCVSDQACDESCRETIEDRISKRT